MIFMMIMWMKRMVKNGTCRKIIKIVIILRVNYFQRKRKIPTGTMTYRMRVENQMMIHFLEMTNLDKMRVSN